MSNEPKHFSEQDLAVMVAFILGVVAGYFTAAFMNGAMGFN